MAPKAMAYTLLCTILGCALCACGNDDGAAQDEGPIAGSDAPAQGDGDATRPAAGDGDGDAIATAGDGDGDEPVDTGGDDTGDDAGDDGSMAGDGDDHPATDDQDLTDPAPGEYALRAGLLHANSEMAVAELDGLIYVIGGYPSTRQVQTTVQVYDPATETWDEAPPLPVAIHHPVVVGVEGKLYSLGGQGAGANGSAANVDLDLTLAYDPSTDEGWVDLEPDPPMTARGAGAAGVIGDRIYVVGGRPPAGNAFEVYDISDNTWEALEPLPQVQNDRNHLAATAIDGKIYVAGGRYDSGSFTGPITDALDIYDPTTGEWSSGAPMPRPRGGVNGVAAFGCFHVFGGEASNISEPNNVFPDHDVYDPSADEWTSVAPMPTPVHGVTGAPFIDGLIYMPGGGTSSGGSSGSTIFQVYRPALRCDGS
ncbi:MAG: hypothetical protein OXT09_20570 [Myxococcales bacterium]|nr:hypothetical protein [Myxococcales bacterium]